MSAERRASLALLAALGCAPEDPPARHALALRNASPAPEARAVVAVHDRSLGGVCTGALVAPRVVLTAGHCVRHPGADAPVDPASLRVTFGDVAGDGSDGAAVVAVWTALGRYTLGGAGGFALVGDDVAALTLAAPSDVAPLALRRDDPRDLAGALVTLYGYGDTPDAPRGERRRAAARVHAVDAESAFVLDQLCAGDSGGPMVAGDGRVAAVASYNDGRCAEGYGVYTLLAPHLARVDEVVRAAGGDAEAPVAHPPDAAADAADAAPPVVDAVLPADVADAAPAPAPAAGCHATRRRTSAGAALAALVAALVAARRRPYRS